MSSVSRATFAGIPYGSSATLPLLEKMKLRPREPRDQNATMLHALVAGEIAIRQAHPEYRDEILDRLSYIMVYI
jgi:hypothetical protein